MMEKKFINDLNKKFKKDEPIFIEDILEALNEYSRATIFRNIAKAKENDELKQFSKGIYYLPEGNKSSRICDSDVVEKRYIANEREEYGMYTGIQLLNFFNVTTQMPVVFEIVTNKESTRKREVEVNGKKYILRKPRIEINNNNFDAYRVLELMNNLDKDEELDNLARETIIDYINENNVSKNDIINMCSYFPNKANKKLIESGVLNEIR